MEKVPKKTQNRKKNITLSLIASVGLLVMSVGVCLWVNRDHGPSEIHQITDPRGSITARKTDEITMIEVRVGDGEIWCVQRGEDGLLHPDRAPDTVIDEELSRNLQDALANIVYEDILTDDSSEYEYRLAEFGLNDPAIMASVCYNDGKKVTIYIGNAVALDEHELRYMIVEGDRHLYTVAASFAEDLMTEKELLTEVVQPEIQSARVDRVTVYENSSERVFELKLNGEITDTDAGENWFLTVPFVYPGDYDIIRQYLQNVGQLRFGLDIGDATDENKAMYGMDANCRVIEIHMAAGSTGTMNQSGAYTVSDHEEETLRFTIGDHRNEMTDYVMYADHIYTMNHFMVGTLADSDPMDFAARYIAPYSSEVLSSLTVEKEGKSDRYEIFRETGSVMTENEGEEETKTVYTITKNGEQIDADTFLAAYQRLMVVTVSGKIPEGTEKKETKVKLTFASVTGHSHVTELSDYDALHDAVTLDGYTAFYMIHDAMEALP